MRKREDFRTGVFEKYRAEKKKREQKGRALRAASSFAASITVFVVGALLFSAVFASPLIAFSIPEDHKSSFSPEAGIPMDGNDEENKDGEYWDSVLDSYESTQQTDGMPESAPQEAAPSVTESSDGRETGTAPGETTAYTSIFQTDSGTADSLEPEDNEALQESSATLQFTNSPVVNDRPANPFFGFSESQQISEEQETGALFARVVIIGSALFFLVFGICLTASFFKNKQL